MTESPVLETTRTVEVRWFVRGELPGAVRRWFGALGDPVGPQSRADRYLAPTSDALGVKLREGRLETKRRDRTDEAFHAGRAQATVEAWTKWSFPLAASFGPAAEADVGADWVVVAKTRWQCQAEAGDGRCALELASVESLGGRWWSVCLEASGPDPEARRAALDAGTDWLRHPDAPALPQSAAMSYPAWLRTAAG